MEYSRIICIANDIPLTISGGAECSGRLAIANRSQNLMKERSENFQIVNKAHMLKTNVAR
jgi:hypothetical protein